MMRSHLFIKGKLPKNNNPGNIVVLGNGPSLKSTIEKYAECLETFHKLAVNFFGNSSAYEDLRPEYYLIADLQFWLQTPSQRFKDKMLELCENINKKTTWNMHFFMPFEAKKSNFERLIRQNQNINIIFFNKTSIDGFKNFRNLCFKLQLGIPRPQNVIVPSLMIILNMGYKNIYLVGADHTWHQELKVDEKNNVTIKQLHFYDNKKNIEHRILLNPKTGKPTKIHEQFESLYYAFKGYHIIKDYMVSLNSKIYNASDFSFIDAFERVDRVC